MSSDQIVINLDIVKQDHIRFFSSSKHTAMYQMTFQCMKEAFGHCIIDFKKYGLILTCVEPTYDLFIDMKQAGLDNNLIDSLDEIHNKFCKKKFSLDASMMTNRNWNMSRDQLSQNYFKWDQLLCMK